MTPSSSERSPLAPATANPPIPLREALQQPAIRDDGIEHTRAKMIAQHFSGMALDAWENVDGVVALTHGSGCGLVPGSEGSNMLVRTLRGYARHPNVGGVLVLGLIKTLVQFEGTLSSWWTKIATGVLLFAFILIQRATSARSQERFGR